MVQEYRQQITLAHCRVLILLFLCILFALSIVSVPQQKIVVNGGGSVKGIQQNMRLKSVLAKPRLQYEIFSSWEDCAQFVCIFKHLNESEYTHYPPIQSLSKKLPFCNDLLFHGLKQLDRLLKNHHIDYYLVFGTLLGSQYNDIFGWTPDVDLAVKADAFEKMLLDPAVHRDLHKSGFVLYRGGERLARVCLSYGHPLIQNSVLPAKNRTKIQSEYYKNFIYYDIYKEFKLANGQLRINPSQCPLSHSDIYPLTRDECAIRNHTMLCPRNKTGILRQHYGPKYNQMIQNISNDEMATYGCGIQ
ncbi:hypothetical protein MIR68_001385 [Amoeboaphelidium protococcarum]|nr:hypothetical protein MIR68_001385 [Amoeboaphelidium protococcarum]